MQGNLFYGSAAALVTPFSGSNVDYARLEALIDRQITAGSDALVVLGTTGEPATLTPNERAQIIECAIARCAGRVPLFVGTGSNSTRTAIVQSVEAARMGADGLLIVTPYYNKASAAGLVAHFHAIADAAELPIIVYNVPARSGLNLPPPVMAELAKHPLLCGLKEASSDIRHIMRMFEATAGGIAIYSGNDELVLPMMALGARGVISVAANLLPMEMHAMTQAFLRGDIDACRAQQLRLLPLMRALFSEVSPIPIKAALARMGLIENTLRLPLTPLDAAKEAALVAEMRRCELLT